MDKFYLPTNFDEISQTIKARIKKEYGLSDVQYEGSNISIISDIMAYAASMINLNMNFGINESVLSLASTRKNIITLARELGYEPAFRKSFKYEIRLKAKKGGLLEIPQFTKFSGGGKDYYFLEKSKAMLFGESINITITNKDRFDNITPRIGSESGDFILSDDAEMFEVLTKTDIENDYRLLLNSVGSEEIDKFSSTKTSFYKFDDTDNTYKKLCGIETYVVDDTDIKNKILICQLKDINADTFPLENDEILNVKFFTDDILKGYKNPDFEGFTPFEFHKTSQVLKFKLQDNVITDSKTSIEYQMNDLLTPFRKKRFCILEESNADLIYNPDLEFCILDDVKPIKETTIIVTEGKLSTYEDDKTLERVVNEKDTDNGFLVLDKQNVEADGVFLEISRVNKKNELILKQPWSKRDTYLPESNVNENDEDTTFLVLENFTSDKSYLKIYTSYSGAGTPFYPGNIFYFKILESSGSKGSCRELMSMDSEVFEVIPYKSDEENPENNLNNKLFSSGSDEETLESIKMNAPLVKNLAERLVTKNDYKIYCSKFQFIESAQIWGGEELDGIPKLGHIYFSFIPRSRPREFESDLNNEVFTLKNRYDRDLFYLPLNQVLSEEKGGLNNSVFSDLEKKKIITLQFHYVPPTYLDFFIRVKIIKYLSNKTEKAQRQMVFDGISEFFKSVEHFDSEIYLSNIVKYVDRKFNDETGISLKLNLETSVIKDDFVEDGFDGVETSSMKYKFQTLFEFPIGGIFAPDITDHLGVITQYGGLIKDKIPVVSSDKDGFLNVGDKIITDWENIEYVVVEAGKEVTKTGPASDIKSNCISFKIPLKQKQDDSSPEKQFGNIVAYPDSRMLYLEINATDSKNSTDLQTKLPISTFEKRRKLVVTNDGDLVLRRNTFPRLMRVEIT